MTRQQLIFSSLLSQIYVNEGRFAAALLLASLDARLEVLYLCHKTSARTVLIYAYHTLRRTALIAGHVDIGKACNNLIFSIPASMSTDSISTFTCCCIAVSAIAVVKVKADEKGTAV